MAQELFVRWLVSLDQFFVGPDLAGRTGVELGTRSGFRVEADFPAPPDSYAYVAEEVNGQPTLIGIRSLWVRAHLTANVSPHPTIDEPRDPTQAEMEESSEIYRLATHAADEVLTMFMNRVAKQQMRFLARMRTPLDDEYAKLFIGSPPKQAKAGKGKVGYVFAPGPQSGLTVSDAHAAAAAISAGQAPDLAWELYARSLRLTLLEANLRQAIIEAAIAVEVALDAAYRRVGQNEPRLNPILKVLIKNLRSIDDQMKEGAAAVLGQSFAAADPASFEKVKALMTERNDIVHNGAPGPTDRTSVQSKLSAVFALLQWLDSL